MGGRPSRAASAGLAGFLSPDGFAGPRGVLALAREAAALGDAAQLVRRSRARSRARGSAPYVVAGRVTPLEPVVLVPGFMAGDSTLLGMAAQLRHEGFRTYRSSLPVNIGCTREAAERLEQRLEAVTERRGRRATVVGHSLGGMLARGVAARRPDLVAGVVSLGSPVLAPGAVHRLLAWDTQLLVRLHEAGLRRVMGPDCVGGDCARLSWEDSRRPLDASTWCTAVYSRRDGVVDWRACLDPAADHVEVHSSHCGMAVAPEAVDAVVDALRSRGGAGLSPASPPAARPA